MSTLTIELKDEQLDRLRRRASSVGLSVEKFASKMLDQISETSVGTEIDEATFSSLLHASIKDNDEAYRRLAQ